MMTDTAESSGGTPDQQHEHNERATQDPLAAMQESADRIREREVRTAIRRLDARGEATAEQREAIRRLADRLVGALLAPPATALREADDDQVRQTAIRLFDPSGPEVGSDD